ncbi:hypothetical protein [Dyella acidiphila]|uniref:Uncharacterized protein n=1 Tax=Dyella acidiphila TaxID=2775866 RepID=A0ABR9G784_9GAMM|nr:hypothetical protein [Dyella acidiphila]MBE1159879.1 hypothetical protein [Dyella acidiphila]
MKSKKMEIMGKVFATAAIAAIAPGSMAMHQAATKAAMHATTASATDCSLDDVLAGLCPDDTNSWS